MKILLAILVVSFFVCGCAMPRLGLKTIKYDDITRKPTPVSVPVRIFSSRQDISFPFVVIGRVQASPPRAERDFGHEPIFYLKQQAREIGGLGLINLSNKDDSSHVWFAEVVAEK
jgi:hypothetical protein